MLKGVDVSNWQAGLNLSYIARDIDFVIVKATEGTYFADKYCTNFIWQAKENGLLYGFYHFAAGGNPESEAEYFYSACKNYFTHGIPVLDFETNTDNNAQWCERFISRLHDLSGVWPLLYISAYRIPEYANSWIPEKCGLWVAGYPCEAIGFDDIEMPYSIAPWEFTAIWQFTSSLQLVGWPDRLDGDYAYMDESAWMKYACPENGTPVQPVLNYIELAKEIVQGKWGNGQERYDRLQAAGYDYDTAQEIVNQYYELACDIWQGKWGNGWNRKNALEGAGYDYELAQMCVDQMAIDNFEGC